MDHNREACQRLATTAQHNAERLMATIMSQGMCDID